MRVKLLLMLLFETLLPVCAAPAEHVFNSNGVRIRYVEEGHGEPVVLVHGFTATLDKQWVATGVFATLSKHYHVIALDDRGHGKSGKPHDPKQYGREMGQDVIRLMDQLRIQRTHLVGYSLGGVICGQLRALHPERFVTITIAGAPPLFAWTAELQRAVEAEASVLEAGDLSPIARRAWPTNDPPPTEAQLKQYTEERSAGQDFQALAAVWRSVGDLAVQQAEFVKITVPTLAIVGTVDPYLEAVTAVKSAMPSLKLVTIPDANHLSALSRPEFVQALQGFLASHSVKSLP